MVEDSRKGANLREFKLERFFNKYEFKVKYLLCCSDCENMSLKELLKYASEGELDRWNNMVLSYSETQGSPGLLTQIQKLYSNIEIEDILTICPQEGIYMAMRTILQPGDEVVCVWPAYQSLYEVALDLKCDIKKWQPKIHQTQESVTIEFDVEDLKKLVTSKTKLVVVNFPHNPTGFLPSQSQFMEIIQICKTHNTLLFCDEMYRRLEHFLGGQLPSVCEVYDNGISLTGLSKAYGLPGLRVGWIVSKNKEFMQKIARYKDFLTICFSQPQMLLAEIAVRNTGALTLTKRDLCIENKRILREFCFKYSKHILFPNFDGGPVSFARFKTDEKDFVSKAETELVDKYQTLIAPAIYFDSEEMNSQNFFRISVGRANLSSCLQQFGKYLDELDK